MDIKKENVLAAYETARKAGADSTMKVLEQLFGEETFKPKDITERIKTFEDAYSELGEDHPFVQAYQQLLEIATREDYMSENFGYDMLAYLKLRIICAALNEGWEPQFTEDEWRYYPWFWLYTQAEIDCMDEEKRQDRRMMSTGDYQTDYAGFASAYSINAPSYSTAYLGSRLCLKSDTLAVYCGKQFIDLWADFYLIRK
jgi:hypothetical protein